MTANINITQPPSGVKLKSMKKKTNYQVTVGYKAVVVFDVKAENEEEAKKIVNDRMKKGGVDRSGEILDQWYSIGGALNMDTTWNTVQN